MHVKMPSLEGRSFCLGLNMLKKIFTKQGKSIIYIIYQAQIRLATVQLLELGAPVSVEILQIALREYVNWINSRI